MGSFSMFTVFSFLVLVTKHDQLSKPTVIRRVAANVGKGNVF